jgi:hypothetical protein
MNPNDRYKKISTGLGGQLRTFFQDALRDADHLPGKRELRARIAEQFGETGLNADKLEAAFVEMARRAQNRGSRFNLRQNIDETVFKVVTKLEEEDRLVPVERNSDDEIAAAVDRATDRYADRIGGELDKARDKDATEARELLRRAGYQA